MTWDGCECSGLKTASVSIKAAKGILKGVTVEMTDTGGDGVVEVWDSPDSTLTDDICLARIRVTSTTLGDMASWSLPVGKFLARILLACIMTNDLL